MYQELPLWPRNKDLTPTPHSGSTLPGLGGASGQDEPGKPPTRRPVVTRPLRRSGKEGVCSAVFPARSRRKEDVRSMFRVEGTRRTLSDERGVLQDLEISGREQRSALQGSLFFLRELLHGNVGSYLKVHVIRRLKDTWLIDQWHGGKDHRLLLMYMCHIDIYRHPNAELHGAQIHYNTQ